MELPDALNLPKIIYYAGNSMPKKTLTQEKLTQKLILDNQYQYKKESSVLIQI